MKNFKKSLVLSPFFHPTSLRHFLSFGLKTPVLQKTNLLNNLQRHPHLQLPLHYPLSHLRLAQLPFQIPPDITGGVIPLYHNHLLSPLALPFQLQPPKTAD